MAEQTSKADVMSATPIAPNGEAADTMDVEPSNLLSTPKVNGDAEKKRRKHEGETPEERAERKRRKKEKKEKKEKRKSKAAEESEESD